MLINARKKYISKSISFLVIAFFVMVNSSILFAKERVKEEKFKSNGTHFVGADSATIANGLSISIGQTYTFVYDEPLSTERMVISRKTSIALSIDDYIAPFYWYDLVYNFKITPIDIDGSPMTSFDIKLKVTNNRYGGFLLNFIDLDKYVLDDINCKGFIIEPLSFITHNYDTGNDETNLPLNVVLKLSHIEETYFKLSDFSAESLNPTSNINTIDNTVNFSWTMIPEVEEYELEWTWVDNYADTSLNDYLEAGAINFSVRDFELNNTRVQLTENNYKIPLIYDSGYIIYRVRFIGRYYDLSDPGNSSKINYYSDWSCTNDAQKVGDWCKVVQVSPHQVTLNWQFQASYAEKGKKKDVVSYFDGTLRNRQTVTKTNTNNKTIVGEVIYDEEGRPAIEVLPAPIDNPALNYYPNFNRDAINKHVYSYHDFSALEELNCNFTSVGMSKKYGASYYYSDESVVQNNNQDFVPDARLFPFSQIKYTNDNTGRIAKKGGVGDKHQVGNGHEMSYFYSVPAQEELNRLFGYYVGNAQHYKKNVVIDPNKQVSVSYIDPQGRTIATALAGEGPDSLKPLEESIGEFVQNNQDLLNKISQLDVDTNEDNNVKSLNNFDNLADGLRYDAQKVNTNANTEFNFYYNLNIPKSFHFACETSEGNLQLYYPFVYKLDIEFRDDCGNLMSGESGISVGDPSQLTVPQATTTSYDRSFSFLPPVGVFGISKRLVVDEVALNKFADDFIVRAIESGCILRAQAPNVDTEGCRTTCEVCTQNLMSMTYGGFNGDEAYLNQMLASNYDLNQLLIGSQPYNDLKALLTVRYNREFELLIEECQRPCEIPGVVVGAINNNEVIESVMCSNSVNQLMSDMLPSGQYGVVKSSLDDEGNVVEDSSSSVPLEISDFPLSVYNEDNELFVYVSGLIPNQKSWRYPHYFNKNRFDIDIDGNGLTNDDYKHYFNEIGEIDYITVRWNANLNSFEPPLKNGYSTIDQLTTQFINATVDASSGTYKVEPQYLANVEDFISYINQKEYWALSLVVYHPEFHYLDYQYAYCDPSYNITFTDLDVNYDDQPDTVTVNSDGFDQLLENINTYADAKDAGLLNNALTFFKHDPYFQKPHPLDGIVISQPSGTLATESNSTIVGSYYDPIEDLKNEFWIARKSIMGQALDLTSGSEVEPTPATYLSQDDHGYDDTGKRMVRAVFDVVACNGPGFDCDLLPNASFEDVKNAIENTSNFTDEDRDRFWGFYKSYYSTLKQKIQHAFINTHAARNGAYNDCIGNEDPQNLNTITTVLNDYQPEKNDIRTWRGNGNVPATITATDITNLCGQLTSTSGTDLADLLVDYEKRFMPYDGLYDSEQSNQQNLNNLLSAGNTAYYQETGLCPILRDLQVFFDTAVKRSSMIPVFNGTTMTTTNQPLMNFITPTLLAAIGGNYAQTGFNVATSSIATDGNGNHLAFNLSQTLLSIAVSPFVLTLPLTGMPAGCTWSNYGTGSGNWSITQMGQIIADGVDNSSTPESYEFKILAKIKKPDGTFIEKVLSGKTKAVLNCGTISASSNSSIVDLGDSPNCDVKETFADDLKNFLTALRNDDIINSTGQNITTKTYFTNSPLWNFFGIQAGDVVLWNGNIGNYTLLVNNVQRLNINATIPSTLSGVNFFNNIYSLNIGQLNASSHTIHGAIVDGSNYSFEGVITGRVLKPLLLTCCSPCGDIDADGDGIGDNGIFSPTGCDTCDDRVPENNCICATSLCGQCNTKRVAFIFKANYNSSIAFLCDDLINLGKEVVEFSNEHLTTGSSTNPFDYIYANDASTGMARFQLKNNIVPLIVPDQRLDNNNVIVDNCNDTHAFPFGSVYNIVTTASAFGIQNDGGGNATIPAINTLLQNTPNANVSAKKIDLAVYFISRDAVGGTYDVGGVNATSFTNFFDTNQGRAKRPFFVLFNASADAGSDGLYNFGGVTTANDYVQNILNSINAVNGTSLTPVLYSGSNASTANYIVYSTRNGSPMFATGLDNGLSKVLENVYDSITDYPYTDNSCQIDQKRILQKQRSDFLEGRATPCPCIPQVVAPVACDEAYDTYILYMQQKFGVGSSQAIQYANSSPTEKDAKDRFCNANLQFLVAGYKLYLDGLGVSSNNMSHYISIATFGATSLNYGFNDYGSVINEYVDYLSNHINEEDLKSWSEYVDFYLSQNPSICPPRAMISSVQSIIDVPVNCEEIAQNLAESYNQDAYNAYILEKRNAFIKAYLKEATEDVVENFNMNFQDKEYQYTLYYYDQAGNLIQTVAPEGVNRMILGPEQNQQIDIARRDDVNISLLPSHKYKTMYRYNSLNQLVWQSTPDGGETRFAYDKLGRIVASQNKKQKNVGYVNDLSLSLGTRLMTEGNSIYNSGSTGHYSETHGFSLLSVKKDGLAEFTVRLLGKPINVLNGTIFGFDAEKGLSGNFVYAFFLKSGGQFEISVSGVNHLQTSLISDGDQLKIELSDGFVRFYKNDLLLLEVVKTIGPALYLGFNLPRQEARLDELRMAIGKYLKDFSYTCYDGLGRINEAGQFTAEVPIKIDDSGKLVYVNDLSWVGVGINNPSVADDDYPHNVSRNQVEVTKTLYDDYGPFNPNDFLTPQTVRNNRNRVTTILTFDTADISTPLENNETAIFYNYDIHGNVEEMAQRISPDILNVDGQPNGVVKRVNYEYDLISGNVNKVIYQKNIVEDQFIHRYNYDADNRIKFVETSRDNEIWERDATYEYYEHGPLARVVTGDKKVQGTDFAYTLQGWLKTVNSENLSTSNKDMGGDGNHVSKDAFGFSLSYFENDYSARHQGTNDAHFVSVNSGIGTSPLYNGNINKMITSVRGVNEEILPTQINLYTYDQLNRIFEMNTYSGTQHEASFASQTSYKSDYSYDKNGNLQTLNRTAPKLLEPDNPATEVMASMDNFSYHYKPFTNKLRHVYDNPLLSTDFEEDIDNQEDDNYKYDEIGQLIKDESEHISNIEWRVDGKVKSINKHDGREFINFFYDGLGNRVAKQVTAERRRPVTTHYARDAQGNVMGVYKLALNNVSAGSMENGQTDYRLQEHHIYGSSRLGLQDYETYEIPTSNHYQRLVGDKRFELSNHLGNVLSVINDKKIINQNVELILIDNFDNEEIGWDPRNSETSVSINEGRELQIYSKDSILGIGVKKIIELEANKTVMFNMNVKRLGDFPSVATLRFEVLEAGSQNVLWSAIVPANGIVSGSFTPTVTADYILSLSLTSPQLVMADFSLDNFYAYIAPSTPVDFVSLFLPDVLNYNDYYPFGQLVP
uniref:DUF6443 domain-containing protein n=1 Tax=Flavobacterium sp. UBA7682 TaxID=1946560 RepID=UPI0025B8D958